MTNPRIESIATGITKERIAVQTHLFYDPATGDVSIAFQAMPCLFVNDVYTSDAGTYEVLTLPLSQIGADTFDAGVDPITNADLSKISALGVVNIIKKAFAVKWDAQVAAEVEHAQPSNQPAIED